MSESRRQVAVRLGGKAGVDPRTARRWLDGEEVQILAVARALEVAAKELGIKRKATK